MDERKSIHAGHRKRMIDKVLNNPSALSDHELLEVLLFSSIPRKNTNETAHKLLLTFGSLNKVFSATKEELLTVDGIGERSACDLILAGKLFERIYHDEKYKTKVKWSSFAKNKSLITDYFRDEKDEVFLCILIDNKENETSRFRYEDHKKFTVSTDISNLSHAIAIDKNACFAIIAHNHPSGTATPSIIDDQATVKIYTLCKTLGITLKDHIIVAGDDAYSYFIEGRFAKLNIKE